MSDRMLRTAILVARSVALLVFWLYVLVALLSIPLYIWALLSSSAARIIWPPGEELILHGLLLVGTAAFGWHYRFKNRFKWFWVYVAALGTFDCAVGFLRLTWQ